MARLFYVTALVLLFHSTAAELCDDRAKEKCKQNNKKSCADTTTGKCGGCLEGFGKVSKACVDISQCKTSDIPSKMVLLLDSSGSLGPTNYLALKNFAKDLVDVFPIKEFAIRSFSSKVTPYPASGAFVTKTEALKLIPTMHFDRSVTRTGDALKHTVKLLKDERDSFNIVVIFTDGRATDGECNAPETCNPTTARCERKDATVPAGSGFGSSSGPVDCTPVLAKEQAWRMWPTRGHPSCKTKGCSCEDMQREWKVCTSPTDPNHATVAQNCPVACGKAQGKCTVPVGSGSGSSSGPTPSTGSGSGPVTVPVSGSGFGSSSGPGVTVATVPVGSGSSSGPTPSTGSGSGPVTVPIGSGSGFGSSSGPGVTVATVPVGSGSGSSSGPPPRRSLVALPVGSGSRSGPAVAVATVPVGSGSGSSSGPAVATIPWKGSGSGSGSGSSFGSGLPVIFSSNKPCTLEIQAPILRALPDRNETVTVVSVGFGNIDPKELQFIATGEGDANTIIAQGRDATDGIAVLEKLMGQLVKKVCNALPVDCVITYTEWSACDAPCGEQYQSRKIASMADSMNGGKPCPTKKAMLKSYKRACPVKRECTATTTVTDAKGYPVTDAKGNPVTDTNGSPITATAGATTTVTDANGNPVTPAAGDTTTTTTTTTTTPFPVDCVVTYTEWSACDAPCGEQHQSRKIASVADPKNGGKPCPTQKAMLKTYKQACPVKQECTNTDTASDDGVVNGVFWVFATAGSAIMLLV